MWPSSTRVGRILDGLRNSFNRSSAMWPSSTWHSSLPPITPLRFQSLKRDVAFFHSPAGIYLHRYPGCFNRSSAMWPSSTHKSSPAAVKSLKRDVAFFHRSPHQGQHRRADVSIAQARCGLLPRYCPCQSARRSPVSIAQARCGLLPLCGVDRSRRCLTGFNRSSAMWPSSTANGWLGMGTCLVVIFARGYPAAAL